jgi:CBS domain containing-hemolysin-like protein
MSPATLPLFLLCLALSFLLSGMEAGVFALSRVRIRQQMRVGNRSARVLYGYLEDPENFLWTILVGNTVANFVILGWIIQILFDALHPSRLRFIVFFVLIVFLFYTLFDLLPKMLFRMYPNRLCMLLARPYRFLHLTLRPLVWLVEMASAFVLRLTGGRAFTGHLFGNREELRYLMQESAQVFSREERAMIGRVLDLQSLTVRQITKPISLAITVAAEMTVEEVLAVARQHEFNRLPVWEYQGGRRRVAGLINLNTLLFQSDLDPAKPVAAFVRPALYVDEDMRVEAALRRMQRSGQRLAVVLTREQRELGIVSLEDILKAVFGEVSL